MNERSGLGLVAWLVKDWFWGIGECRRNGERPGWWGITGWWEIKEIKR